MHVNNKLHTQYTLSIYLFNLHLCSNYSLCSERIVIACAELRQQLLCCFQGNLLNGNENGIK